MIPLGLIEAVRNRGISEEEAYRELRGYWPDSDVRIHRGNGFVKVWRNRTLMTNRPTLMEAIARLRWYVSYVKG